MTSCYTRVKGGFSLTHPTTPAYKVKFAPRHARYIHLVHEIKI